MDMTAAIARTAGGPFSLEACSIDAPQEDEVLVRIHACGICHTDLAAKHQHLPAPLPIVLGHEGAGVVEQVGKDVTGLQKGDHVVLSFGSCGHCTNCKQGHPGYCDSFRDINVLGKRKAGSAIRCEGLEIFGGFFAQSSFASYALANGRNAVKVPADLPLDVLAPLGCGIQTGVATVLNCLQPFAGSSIAVFGVGAVGLAAVMAAKIAGCTTIVAIDRMKSRLEIALDVGATHVVDAGSADLRQQLSQMAGGGLNFSLDTTGNSEAVGLAIDCLAKRGVAALIAVAAPGVRYSFDPNSFVGRGIRIVGAIEGNAVPTEFIPKLVEFYRLGQLPLERLVSTFPLSRINDAAAAMKEGTVIKPVLLM
jgi:aryl-alcohol dehydrogenase